MRGGLIQKAFIPANDLKASFSGTDRAVETYFFFFFLSYRYLRTWFLTYYANGSSVYFTAVREIEVNYILNHILEY